LLAVATVPLEEQAAVAVAQGQLEKLLQRQVLVLVMVVSESLLL
tara:strand:+ start:402 stop:533 length:132 start_codon:yes stop_codon:yes gene_type:complete